MSKFTAVVLRQRMIEEKVKITVTALNEEAAEARISLLAKEHPNQGHSEDCSRIQALSVEPLDVATVTFLAFSEDKQ